MTRIDLTGFTSEVSARVPLRSEKKLAVSRSISKDGTIITAGCLCWWQCLRP